MGWAYRGLIGLLSLCLVATARAQPPPGSPPPAAPASRSASQPGHDPLTPLDGVGVAALSVGLMVLGGILGLDNVPDCPGTPNLDYRECPVEYAPAIVGALVGYLIGPVIYDLMNDRAGSLLRAYAGLVLGALPGLLNDSHGWAVLGSAVGMGVGYAWRHHEVTPFRPTINVQSEPSGGRRFTAGVGFSF